MAARSVDERRALRSGRGRDRLRREGDKARSSPAAAALPISGEELQRSPMKRDLPTVEADGDSPPSQGLVPIRCRLYRNKSAVAAPGSGPSLHPPQPVRRCRSTVENNSVGDNLDEMEKITVRGPGCIGQESFDRECIFGNKLEMNFNQVMHLRSYVDELPRPPIKKYVAKLTKSVFEPGEEKIEFSAEYTRAYLLQFLMTNHPIRLCIPASSQAVSLAVSTPSNSAIKYCVLSLGDSGKAMINGRAWPKALQQFDLKEGDICMFSFKNDRGIPSKMRDPFAWLRLVIMKLE